MKALSIYDILRRPLITEKGTNLQADGKYAFEVSLHATKHQIKTAVEQAFKVEVLAVNVMNIRGKTKRIKSGYTTDPSWKKAIVSLKAGDKIELFEGV
ncbi:MAG: 50S ribosomal protein L23 [Dehalococcoidia bacterium]|nr:50S ribosomal protein L23 [Dehalococcoidia bacterium]